MTDPQAQEMATYPLDEWLKWEHDHCDQDGTLNHATRIEDCAICRWGCQVAGCDCA